jgi:hypothetical protein
MNWKLDAQIELFIFFKSNRAWQKENSMAWTWGCINNRVTIEKLENNDMVHLCFQVLFKTCPEFVSLLFRPSCDVNTRGESERRKDGCKSEKEYLPLQVRREFDELAFCSFVLGITSRSCFNMNFIQCKPIFLKCVSFSVWWQTKYTQRTK